MLLRRPFKQNATARRGCGWAEFTYDQMLVTPFLRLRVTQIIPYASIHKLRFRASWMHPWSGLIGTIFIVYEKQTQEIPILAPEWIKNWFYAKKETAPQLVPHPAYGLLTMAWLFDMFDKEYDPSEEDLVLRGSRDDFQRIVDLVRSKTPEVEAYEP